MQPLVGGVTCRDESCDFALGTDHPAERWDLIERMRVQHEDKTGHQTHVECLRESRIIPDWSDRDALSEAVMAVADDAIEYVCPECDHVATHSDPQKRCPDCNERWRQALP